MTAQAPLPHLSTGTHYESLAARFRPIFARIAESSVARERDRTLPHEPIQWLKDAASAPCVYPSNRAVPALPCHSCSSC